MEAAIYRHFKQPINIEKVQDPVPSANGVVIRVRASGLCLSDWHGWMGHDKDIRLPHVPGHELAGDIVALGKNVKGWSENDRVTVPFVCGCGQCPPCLSGNQQVCDHQFQPGFTAWGSFAEYVAIDYAQENLVRLPENIGYTAAASLGCRFVTSYRAIRDQGNLQRGQYLAVHGCGGVGLSAIQIGKALGATVIAIDISEDKCKLAEGLGADYSINALTAEVVEAVKDISNGGVHLSLDALGSTTTCLNSIKNLRKLGRHVQVGLLTDQDEFPKIPMADIIAKELEIVGSHGMQATKYKEMFELIAASEIDLEKMVTRTIPLRQVPEYLPKMNSDTTGGLTVMNMH